MAIIAVLCGGILAFASFLAALLIFETGIMAAFGIYLATGFAVSALILIAGTLPPRENAAETQTA